MNVSLSSHPAGEKIRIGVIGAGAWTIASHLPNLARHSSEVEFTIVCRRDPKRLRDIQQRFGFRRSSVDWHDVVAEPLDLVLVATPPALHHEQVHAALSGNAHVICDKPFTLRAADAWDLVGLASSRRRNLVIAYGWNYREAVRQAREIVSGGELGTVEHISLLMSSQVRSLLLAGQSRYQAAEYLSQVEPGTYTDPDLAGGGYGQAQLTHAIALALWITGQRASRVAAVLGGPEGRRVELDISIVVEFQGGATGSVAGISAHESTEHGREELELRVTGSNGHLLLSFGSALLTWRRAGGVEHVVPLRIEDVQYDCVGPIEAMVSLIHGRGDNESPGELGARVVEVLDASYRSSVSGRFEVV